MAITATDIQFRLSVTTGAAGDSTAGTPAGSLGKYISTTQITDASIANLFDNISGDENAASTVDYRLFFVLNNHASLTWLAPVVWIFSEVGSGASLAISVDTTATLVKTSASVQAKTIVDELTAPATQTFSSPTTKGTGLALSDIPPLGVKGIWVRRTAANTAAVDSDGGVIRVEGDTAA